MNVLLDSQFILLSSFISSDLNSSFEYIGCSSCSSGFSPYSLENDFICSNSALNSSLIIAGCVSYFHYDNGKIQCAACDSGFVISKEKDRCLQIADIQWGGSLTLLEGLADQ